MWLRLKKLFLSWIDATHFGSTSFCNVTAHDNMCGQIEDLRRPKFVQFCKPSSVVYESGANCAWAL